MKIFFAGTPSCAVPALNLIAREFDLCGVLTNPPAPAGRNKKIRDSEIAAAVKELIKEGTLPEDFPVLMPQKLDEEFRKELITLKPDLLVCFAYGKIFGPKTMAVFPLGGINIHPSLLPRWRGSAPVPAAILAGDRVTGITIQTLAQKTDSGNILGQLEIPLNNSETTESLLADCSGKCCPLLRDVLSDFENKLKTAKPQEEAKALYCSMLKKEDGLIDWSKSAQEIERKIRAFTPWPGCFTFKKGEKINIIEADLYDGASNEMTKNKKFGTILGTDKKRGILVQTGNGILAVSVLQKQAKKKLEWKDFLNGSSDFLDGGFET
ncbi:methionyl-tRNA formyltransferase [Treponema putidum]|uniref:Methionyl-tRNA formyltransferase n=1 Tax=Treponema putidum TaxID=221027 RepID=A0AAE9MTP7_9SPIR|nr:methionyl-tRNA formyltransferase [Treponema putidum]AIN94644.1 methionyl-tRNA formyltransferase [Treponema putidum]TWI78751.1 methionyl-tRNA formyltransferase [Treponema putidum]UTY28667.1 methionyl-tRNA formyltransferase [Treponema putidum]UTY31101.1 methionyl-tRNA formyltransferase [Treponema putidum]UTY33532.1 methionyl-tRNA formyltransferase [Treponema putidum]